MMDELEAEADRNYDAFLSALPMIEAAHRGKHALLCQSKIVGFFDSSLEATLSGLKQFGAGRFLVQEVAATPEHLGFYSYVGGSGAY